MRQSSTTPRKLSVIVISDEIYARLEYSGTHTCLAELYPEGTILTSGFSKWSSAGGWRLGYAHFPPSLDQLKRVRDKCTLLECSAGSAERRQPHVQLCPRPPAARRSPSPHQVCAAPHHLLV